MPVFLPIPLDPTDILVQGEMMRVDALSTTISVGDGMRVAMTGLQSSRTPVIFGNNMIPGDIGLPNVVVEDGMIPPSFPTPLSEHLPCANGVIATTAGALIPHTRVGMLLRQFEQATDTFTISGQTLTGAGVALGDCRVMVYETGRMAVDGHAQAPLVAQGLIGTAIAPTWQSQSPVVGEAIADASGNFTIPVPMNTAYQLTAYLAGSPDRAGITKNNVVPTTASTPIYVRDPTTPDAPGGSAAYRPIGSPVVRRLS